MSRHVLFLDVPILFGEIYFAYMRNEFQHNTSFLQTSFYICYNQSQYTSSFSETTNTAFNNTQCIRSKPFVDGFNNYQLLAQVHIQTIYELYQQLNRYHLIFNYTSDICNRSNMYQCLNSSKCISIYHLMNQNTDCPSMDDEDMVHISTTNAMARLDKTHYKCQISGKYIPLSFVSDGRCDCDTRMFLL